MTQPLPRHRGDSSEILPSRRSFLGTAGALLGGLAGLQAAPPRGGQGEQAQMPAWRRKMTAPNTIYDISDNTIISLKCTFPGGTIPAQFSNGDGEAGTGGPSSVTVAGRSCAALASTASLPSARAANTLPAT